MSVLVGRKAPDFCAAAVFGSGEIIEDFHFEEAIKDKYALLFFYPLDSEYDTINFVCISMPGSKNPLKKIY